NEFHQEFIFRPLIDLRQIGHEDMRCQERKTTASFHPRVDSIRLQDQKFQLHSIETPQFRYSDGCVKRFPVDRTAGHVYFQPQVRRRIDSKIQFARATNQWFVLYVVALIRLESFCEVRPADGHRTTRADVEFHFHGQSLNGSTHESLLAL